jgi:hypothetical protein
MNDFQSESHLFFENLKKLKQQVKMLSLFKLLKYFDLYNLNKKNNKFASSQESLSYLIFS